MINRLLFIASLCLGGAFFQPAYGQDLGVVQQQIMILDPERLFDETQLGQRMLAEHQTQRDRLASSNRKLEAELEAEERRLTEIRAETDPTEFRELADAFNTRVQQIRRDSERRALDLERDRERLQIQFLRAVEPVLLEVMRESGATVVLDARTVLFRTETADVTGLVVQRIDAAFGGEAETTPDE